MLIPRTCLVALLASFIFGSVYAEETAAQTSQLADLLGSDADPAFARALTPREFVFPEDHGPHPDFRNEWWYVTGNLDNEDGERFGFELTIFRFALVPTVSASNSAWRTNQVWMAHVALSDATRGRHLESERFARGAVGLAGWLRVGEPSQRGHAVDLGLLTRAVPDGDLDAAVEAGCASAGETLHVGDHPWFDVHGARQAGLRTAWVNRNEQPWPDEYEAPDVEVRHVGSTAVADLPAKPILDIAVAVGYRSIDHQLRLERGLGVPIRCITKVDRELSCLVVVHRCEAAPCSLQRSFDLVRRASAVDDRHRPHQEP